MGDHWLPKAVPGFRTKDLQFSGVSLGHAASTELCSFHTAWQVPLTAEGAKVHGMTLQRRSPAQTDFQQSCPTSNRPASGGHCSDGAGPSRSPSQQSWWTYGDQQVIVEQLTEMGHWPASTDSEPGGNAPDGIHRGNAGEPGQPAGLSAQLLCFSWWDQGRGCFADAARRSPMAWDLGSVGWPGASFP